MYPPPLNDGTPNEHPYHLRYPDGDLYVERDGRGSQREFSLDHAILLANGMADQGLMVVEPENGTVLWTGRMVTRSR